MKILSDFNLSVDKEEVDQLLEKIKGNLPSINDKALLKKIFSFIDRVG